MYMLLLLLLSSLSLFGPISRTRTFIVFKRWYFPTSFALLFSTKRENCPTLCRKFVPEMGNSTAIVKWIRPINVPKPTWKVCPCTRLRANNKWHRIRIRGHRHTVCLVTLEKHSGAYRGSSRGWFLSSFDFFLEATVLQRSVAKSTCFLGILFFGGMQSSKTHSGGKKDLPESTAPF